jgi:RNA-splicing ligase RtcB
MGTLGGGNHFIEMNIDRATGMHYLSIHRGSRNLGQHVMLFHQGIITRDTSIDLVKFNREKRALRDRCKGNVSSLESEIECLRERLTVTKHTPYLEGSEAYAYYFDMIITQHYARMNREIMLTRILVALGFQMPGGSITANNIMSSAYDPSERIETIHNYIDFHDFVLRKGAIAAPSGKLCIIALNMCDGLLLCRGRGNADWNESCAHGAGRILMTRKEAKRDLEIRDFVQKMEMNDVYSTCIVPEVLDEAPAAYKDAEFIKRMIGASVEIVAQLHAVWNIKSWVRNK